MIVSMARLWAYLLGTMELTLIFPHQLFDPHPAIGAGREILLLEDPLFFGRDARWPLRLHRQKLVLHRDSLTHGMWQFADGGIFTTKPYLSGSNYVRKMSDYSAGPWCEGWDGLFWTFITDTAISS